MAGRGSWHFYTRGGGSVLQVVCAVSHTPTPTHRTHTGSEGTKGPKMSTSKFGWVDLDRDSNQPPAGRGRGRSFCNGQSSRPRTMHPPPGVETTATPRGRFCARHSDSVYQKRLCITCITSKNFGHHLCRVHHQQEFCAALCVLSEKLYITCVPPTKVLCITTKL